MPAFKVTQPDGFERRAKKAQMDVDDEGHKRLSE